MELNYLRTFIEVARCNSFTKAAEQLGYAQSSVTQQIQKLELEYNASLFERYGRHMKLTSAGEQLFDRFVEILALYDSSKELVSGQMKGSLVIGTIESMIAYFLPPVIQKFRRAYPDITIQVRPVVEECIIPKVRYGDLDIGLFLGKPVSEDGLHTAVLREEPLVFVAEPCHPIFQDAERGLACFENFSYVATEQGCVYRSAFEALLSRHGIEYRIHHEFGSLEAIKQCVGFGLGVGLLPRITVERELALGILKELPFSHPDISMSNQYLYHKRKWLNPALQHFIKLLEAAISREAGAPEDEAVLH